MSVPVKVGITLPSFRDEVGPSLAIAAAAEASGLDGVFAYDHLFRRDAHGNRRPALEMFALMGAVAGATTRVAVGSLVARATLRPPATLANGFDSLARILGPDRLLVAIGAGDAESREENETFGLEFGTVADRVARVARRGRRGARPRLPGVGRRHGSRGARGRGRARRRLEPVGRGARAVPRAGRRTCSAAAARSPFTLSWGGLVVLGDDDEAAAAKAERLGAGDHVLVGGPERRGGRACGRTPTPAPSG